MDETTETAPDRQRLEMPRREYLAALLDVADKHLGQCCGVDAAALLERCHAIRDALDVEIERERQASGPVVFLGTEVAP